MGKGLKDGADGEQHVDEDLGSEAEPPSETKTAEDIDRPNIDKGLESNNPKDNSVTKSSQLQTSEETSKDTSRKGIGGLFNCPLCLFIVEKKARLPEHLLNSSSSSSLLSPTNVLIIIFSTLPGKPSRTHMSHSQMLGKFEYTLPAKF